MSPRVVVRQIDAAFDPCELYQVLTAGRPDTALLESGDMVEGQPAQSLILERAALRIDICNRTTEVRALSAFGERLCAELAAARALRPFVTQREDRRIVVHHPEPDPRLEDLERLTEPGPLDVPRTVLASVDAPARHRLLIGLFHFELLAAFEQVPGMDRDAARAELLLAERFVRVDHAAGTTEVVELGRTDRVLEAKLLGFARRPNVETGDREARPAPAASIAVDLEDEAFAAVVGRCREHIHAGDVFQVVPSRSFRVACTAPFDAYRRLRALNPSAYQFYLHGAGGILFGASPETCVKVEPVPDPVGRGPRLTLRPIAGTRPRGRNGDGEIVADLDSRLSAELVLDRKEQAEHVMLVDLARNDVARVCVPGSRRVTRLLALEHYSHVTHLVSEVQGELRPGLDALHAYQACMNMGTLTGAPKLRASELIAELEGDRRGPYGGAVAYLLGDGGVETSFDSAIVIRSAHVVDGVATVRAGAGVVRDSDPRAEADETRRKAEAVLEALRPSSREGQR